MAHDKCIGTWEKSRLNGVNDGKIRVDFHEGNDFEGEHLDTHAPLENTFCDGTNIRFSRTDPNGHKRVFYRGEIILDGPKSKIRNGHFSEQMINSDRVAAKGPSTEGAGKSAYAHEPVGETDAGGDEIDASDDWTAEKPT